MIETITSLNYCWGFASGIFFIIIISLIIAMQDPKTGGTYHKMLKFYEDLRKRRLATQIKKAQHESCKGK